MDSKKLWIRFNLGDLAQIIDGCHKGNYGKIEKMIYDKEGLKYDIRLDNGRLCSEVLEYVVKF